MFSSYCTLLSPSLFFLLSLPPLWRKQEEGLWKEATGFGGWALIVDFFG